MIFKESEKVALKSVVVDDIKKEIISFANSTGGKLYIGVLDDGTVIGVDHPDEVALQVSNMIRDAIKPDLTMFLHYETLNIENKQVVVIDVQRGTNRPYYIAKKGIRPEGVYIRQDFSSAPASQSLIRQMIKETDGDYFENSRSIEQNLTFDTAKKHFAKKNLPLEEAQMKTLGILNYDGTKFFDILMFRIDGLHGHPKTTQKYYDAGHMRETASGIVFEAPNEKNFYLCGDTIWYEGVEKALQKYRPEVIAVNGADAQFADSGSIIMGLDDILQVCKAAPRAKVIVTHLDAVPHALVGRKEVKNCVSQHHLSAQVVVPDDGETCQF